MNLDGVKDNTDHPVPSPPSVESHRTVGGDISAHVGAKVVTVDNLVAFFIGLGLVLLGSCIVLGGFILYFGNKSGRLVTFPYAGGLTIVVGLGFCGGGVGLTGRRGAIGCGTILVGIGAALFLVGYPNEPPLRVLAPLGFFLGIIGYVFIRVSLSMASDERRDRAASKRKEVGKGPPLDWD